MYVGDCGQAHRWVVVVVGGKGSEGVLHEDSLAESVVGSGYLPSKSSVAAEFDAPEEVLKRASRLAARACDDFGMSNRRARQAPCTIS